MKNLFQLLLLLSFSLMSFAQNKPTEKYVISSISDNGAYIQQGKKRIAITQGSTLSGRDIIALKPGMTMIAILPSANLRYTIKGAYTGAFMNYIKQNKESCVKTITSKYMNYLLKQAFHGRKDDSGALEDNEATVFRKSGLDNDSVTMSLKSVDSLYTTIDSLSVIRTDSIH